MNQIQFSAWVVVKKSKPWRPQRPRFKNLFDHAAVELNLDGNSLKVCLLSLSMLKSILPKTSTLAFISDIFFYSLDRLHNPFYFSTSSSLYRYQSNINCQKQYSENICCLSWGKYNYLISDILWPYWYCYHSNLVTSPSSYFAVIHCCFLLSPIIESMKILLVTHTVHEIALVIVQSCETSSKYDDTV